MARGRKSGARQTAGVSIEELRQRFSPDSPAPVYALYGDEDLCLQEARALLRVGVLGDEHAVPLTFEGRDADPSTFFDTLQTPSLFAGRQLIVLEDSEEFLKQHVDRLLDYLGHPLGATVLIMMFKSWNRQWRIAKRITQVGVVVNCKGIPPWEIPRWLQRRAQADGRQMSQAAAERLAELVGVDLGQCGRQLEAVITYVGERDRVTQDDVDALVGSDFQRDVWKLLDAVVEGRPGEALLVLGRLLREGEESVRLIALLAFKIREIVQTRMLMGEGASPGEIARAMKRPPRVVQRMMDFAGRNSQAELLAKFRAVVEADVRSKSGGASTHLLLEELVMTLCREGVEARA